MDQPEFQMFGPWKIRVEVYVVGISPGKCIVTTAVWNWLQLKNKINK
jgi:hypothetical protein